MAGMKICPRCMRQYDDDVAECLEDGAQLRSFQDSSSQIIGQVLDGRWRIDEKIGEGGMGEVYRARQVNVDRVVAVKILRLALASTEQYVARFFREADIATSVQHPHFVSIYDFGQTEGQLLYIAMELLDGEPLAAVLKRRRLDLVEVLTIAIQVCAALAAAHNARIVHRDLKPDNIFLLDTAEGDTFAKVLDFGIAKDLDSTDQVTRTGQLFGTPEYMSPEQCEGSAQVDGRSDLYALGCIVYELLTGRSPFQRDSIIQTLLAQVSDEPKSFGELGIPVPSGVTAIVMKLLEKHPDNRFGTAIEAREALVIELDRLRANSGEIHVYETVSATIKPRLSSARTVSYSDLAHPLQLEGVLADSSREAIRNEAQKRREAAYERATEDVSSGRSGSRRWLSLAIVGSVLLLGGYVAFQSPTPEPPPPPPVPVEISPAIEVVRSAIGSTLIAVRSNTAQEQARRRAAAVALVAATVALGPRAASNLMANIRPAPSPRDPSALEAGIGVRTTTSMRTRVLKQEAALLECYNKRSEPSDGGVVKFVFAIGTDGRQTSTDITSDSLRSTEVLSCMKQVVEELQFYPADRSARFETNLTFKSSQ